MNFSADEIASKHPQASLAAIYAALTYYHDHRAEIDEQMRQGKELAEELRRSYLKARGQSLRRAAAVASCKDASPKPGGKQRSDATPG